MPGRLAFALATLATSLAWAQPYLGGSIGQAQYRNACAGAPAGITCESGDTAIRFFAGYSFTPHVGVELGYGTLGTVHASTGESIDLSAADLSAIGSWPVGGRLSAQARLGVYRGTTAGRAATTPDNTLPCPGAPPGGVPPLCPQPSPPPERGWQGGNNTDVTYGLGLTYPTSETGMLRVEWQRFANFGGGNGAKFDTDLLSIGVLVNFR